MKKVIRGKLYDTATAENLYYWDNGNFPMDFKYRAKTLYRTPKGNLFLHHEGGAMTDMAKSSGSNWTAGSENIEPIDKEDAIRFLESHGGTEVLLNEFPGDIEEA